MDIANNFEVTFNGTWEAQEVRSNTKENTILFDFTGSSIAWYADKNVESGIAEIFIDGKFGDGIRPTYVNLFSKIPQTKVKVFERKLPNGSHTIKVRVTAFTGGGDESKGAYVIHRFFEVDGITSNPLPQPEPPTQPEPQPEPPPPSTNIGKINYTLDGGFKIQGVDLSNPVIYDNDFVNDCPSDEILWIQAHKKKINLVGNVMTRSMDGGPNNYHWTHDRTVSHWDGALARARNSGITVLAPVRGAGKMLTVPSNKVIDSTVPIASPGSDLIIREAKKCTAAKPLVIFVGGCATTVASAYLKDKSIADKIIVLHINGYKSSPTTPQSYNLADPWAAYIVMKKMRYVDYSGNGDWYGRPIKYTTNLTLAMINSLPNNQMSAEIKRWFTGTGAGSYQGEFLADAPIVLWFFKNSLWTNVKRKLENGSATTSNTYDFLSVSGNNWNDYGPLIISLLK